MLAQEKWAGKGWTRQVSPQASSAFESKLALNLSTFGAKLRWNRPLQITDVLFGIKDVLQFGPPLGKLRHLKKHINFL